jgi:hypothetical protein
LLVASQELELLDVYCVVKKRDGAGAGAGAGAGGAGGVPTRL